MAKDISMDAVKVIEIKKSVFEDNDKDAAALRRQLKARGVYLLNLMSSPGSGKTTTLIKLLNRIKGKLRVAVMEADIDSDVDAVKILEATGVPSIQLHTGGMCHLDAEMTRQGLTGLPEAGLGNLKGAGGCDCPEGGRSDAASLDLVILENVGNLVCPAEFDTGACRNAMILSVPEGHDKPLKYPLMFTVCDLVIVNKIDVMPYFDFDLDKCREYVAMRNPRAEVIPICAKTGEGVDALADWILKEVKAWKSGS